MSIVITLKSSQVDCLLQLARNEIDAIDGALSEEYDGQDIEELAKSKVELVEICERLIVEHKLVAVPFGVDGITGDSCWLPETNFDYNDDMSEDDMLIRTAGEILGSNYTKSVEYARASLIDEDYNDLAGWWIVDENIYKFITNTDCSFGNDSAIYARIRDIKSAIHRHAIKTITVELKDE